MAPAADPFDALYDGALRAAHQGDQAEAERLMAQAEMLRPEIRRYGHMARLLWQRGKVGGYRDHLSAADITYVDDYFRDTLDDYCAFYKPPR